MFQRRFAPVLLFTTLIGCGGSNTDSPQKPSPTPLISSGNDKSSNQKEPKWVKGEFSPSNAFKNYCEVPRTGIDPLTNAPYLDQQGSAMHEKLWLRSWSQETYLWNDELPDIDPNGYSVIEYFDLLKTDVLTPSGKQKDNYHSAVDSNFFFDLFFSQTNISYGIHWHIEPTTLQRTVAFIEQGSPADNGSVTRGMTLIRVNDIDLTQQISKQTFAQTELALNPTQLDAVIQLVFEDLNSTKHTIELHSANVEDKLVNQTKVIETNSTKLGYIQFNAFVQKGQQPLIDAFNSLIEEDVTDLVLDLRYNEGGLMLMASQLAYMIIGDENIPSDGYFEKAIYNPNIQQDQFTPFVKHTLVENNGQLAESTERLPTLGLSRVFILSTQMTCSASESIINNLAGLGIQVVLIGEATCGKPYRYFPTDNCGTTYMTIQYKGENYQGYADFSDGLIPSQSPSIENEILGCPVEDDFTRNLGDTSEALLSAAITYANTGVCPQDLPVKAPEKKHLTNPYLLPVLTEKQSFRIMR